MRKKRLTSLLCAVLCLALLAAVAVVPASAAGSCNGKHSWDGGKTVVMTDCNAGYAEVFVKTCTVCGAEQHISFRPVNGHESEFHATVTTDNHKYETHEYTSDCSGNPIVEKHCTVCGHTVISGGGHEWVDGEVKYEHDCAPGVKTITCKKCNATRTATVSARTSHVWSDTITDQPTCEESGRTYRVCTVCGATQVSTTIPPTGHRWGPNSSNPHGVQECEKCHKKITDAPAGDHIWSDWKSDQSGHWLECVTCYTRKPGTEDPHTDRDNDYRCDVCGYSLPKPAQACSHSWTVMSRNSTTTHAEQCTKCGETRTVTCATAGKLQNRTSCTDPTYCVCGNKVAEGQKNHNYGTLICHDDCHERKCLNPGCNQTDKAAHTYTNVAGTMLCSVCSYVDKANSVPHTHTFGAWTVGSNGCVARCTDPSCTEFTTAAHVPGTADCAGNAVCVNCGAKVTTTPSSTHGPTEVRNAKAADVGVAGYSGDTWCLTCNKVIATGHAIEALQPSHVHTYTVKHDSGSHWQECECGARQGTAAHSYVGGVCSCGEKEPVKAPAHTHSYAAAFKSDSEYHWHECTSCGEKIEREEHLFIDGKCACGMTYGNYEALVEVKDEKYSVVNRFTDVLPEGFYTLSVQRMFDAGLMSGKGSGFFDVNGTANRKEFMAVLARLNNVEGSNVAATWDTVSVNWCVEKGYAAKGDVNARVTRAEIVTILWKMAGKPSVSYDISKFTDSGKLTGETLSAMKWAVANGIMYGRGNTIQPESDANRGEIASFVARYIDLMEIAK